MLKLGTKVRFYGHPCEIMGVKLLNYGKGPAVYEIVLLNQKKTYLRKFRELREINNRVIAHIKDERLRRLDLVKATDKDKKLILNSPIVGFINVSEEELQVVN